MLQASAFSPDGTEFAYRVFDDAGGLKMHLRIAGQDRVLYTQEPVGGHGGPPYGPYDQLQFSPDGTELLDFWMFRPTSGPLNLLVFKSDGSILFQESGTVSGVWSPTENLLYFSVLAQSGLPSEVDSLDPAGQRATVVSGLKGYFWPVMAPNGGAIIYDTYDTSVPGQATGGLPHLWRLDLSAHSSSQLGSSVSSRPVFVEPTFVWSNEEKPCECGPGGASAVDGVVIAHDVIANRDATVDMALTVPGIGAPAVMPSTGSVLDAWF